jgi:hypothetical protein
MTKWPGDELLKIVDADDLHVSPLRADGTTPGTPTWIWCVAVDGELFVRAYHGQASRWYQAALARKSGRIVAAGVNRQVTFERVSGRELDDAIDAAYRAKYAKSPYLQHMVGASARSATVRIAPG